MIAVATSKVKIKKLCQEAWSKEEDDRLKRLVEVFGEDSWERISLFFPAHDDEQCQKRWCRVNSIVVKGPWTNEEDAKLVELIKRYGPKKWNRIGRHMNGRIGKQCRERWFNHLNPDIKKTAWTTEEERLICYYQRLWGNQWSKIAKQLPGRTDNAIKNHWHTSVKRNKVKLYEDYVSSLRQSGVEVGQLLKLLVTAPKVLVGDKFMESPVHAEGTQDAPSTSSSFIVLSSSESLSPSKDSEFGNEPDEEPEIIIDMDNQTLFDAQKQEEFAENNDLTSSVQACSTARVWTCSADLHNSEVQEKSVQVSEGVNLHSSLQANSTLLVLSCSDVFYNADSKMQEKSVQVYEVSDKFPLGQIDSVPINQTESETLTQSIPDIALKIDPDSLNSHSSEALMISKVIKSEKETSFGLEEEKKLSQFHEEADSNSLSKEIEFHEGIDCIEFHEEAESNSLPKEIEVQDSEIMWSLFCVKHQLPYRTFNTIEFQKMFPDSSLAHLTADLDPERLAYIVSYGLELYFRMELFCCLKKTDYCVLVFKEHFYTTAGFEQIDIYIRFWNHDTYKVDMRYLNSVIIKFAGEEENTIECLWQCLKDVENYKIIQLCLDGSPVNLHYLSYLQEKIKKNYAYSVVNINNSLHSIYEAFERGAEASEWNLGDILRSLYLIFKDSPVRCREYMKITHSQVLPLPFHSERLLLNIQTAERAFEIWSYIKEYLHFICTECPYLLKLNHFAIIKHACNDVFMPTKLNFFISIGKRMEDLINLFKSDKPMLPFFYRELKAFSNRCKSYYNAKKCNYSDMLTVDKLVDFEPNNNHSTTINNMHLGFSGEKILGEISQCNVTIMQEIVMKASAQVFVLKLNENLSKDSYLNNPLFEYLSCLDPPYMVNNTKECNNKFAHILSIFMENNHLNARTCEELRLKFSVFLDSAVSNHKNDFQNFDPTESDSRLDTFLHHYLAGAFFEKLRHFIKEILLLFNGHVDSQQTGLSEGYDFKQFQEDYVARHFISDHLKRFDTKLTITDEMRHIVNEALQNHMDVDNSISESPT